MGNHSSAAHRLQPQWFAGEEWQCGGCTGFTSQFTRLEFLAPYHARRRAPSKTSTNRTGPSGPRGCSRSEIVTQGGIDEALAYKARVGNRME